MPCNMPIDAYYSDKLNDGSGKRSLTFNRKYAYQGGDPTIPEHLAVPCGKCHGCRADQALMWSIRGYHESTLHQQNSFLTLTYSDGNLPADGKIDKRPLQTFFKRLRKSGIKLRYIACGEYGSKTRRPHYHAIIFGKDWLENSIPINSDLYANQQLTDAWGLGHVTAASVTMASICYVCGYVNKKIDDEDTFSLMSRRPGIGHDFLDRYKDDLLRTGLVTIDGRQYQIPKRYLMWDEDQFADIKRERAKYARDQNHSSQSAKNFYAARAREINLQSNKKSKQEKI